MRQFGTFHPDLNQVICFWPQEAMQLQNELLREEGEGYDPYGEGVTVGQISKQARDITEQARKEMEYLREELAIARNQAASPQGVPVKKGGRASAGAANYGSSDPEKVEEKIDEQNFPPQNNQNRNTSY